MPSPRIAIVGRPNVGKSSLLNRLVRRRVSIVDPTPGVTRDRVTAAIKLDPPIEGPGGLPSIQAELIDTGGYGVYVAQGKRYDDVGADLASLTPDIESQIMAAVEAADVILFVIDAQDGLTSQDQAIARLLRQRGAADRIILVANKVDDESWLSGAQEAAALGFGAPACISAVSNFGVRALLDELYGRITSAQCRAERAEHETPDQDAGTLGPQHSAPGTDLALAIVGKRNAGKSTLVNALAGEERVIVSEIAGTTRDSIDVRIEIDGKPMLIIDTAGLRKRKSFADDIEYYAYHRMLAAIRRADVALLLIDATTEVSSVDAKLAQELLRQAKPTVIVVNKWDLVDEKRALPAAYQEYLTKELRGLEFAPIVFTSAAQGEGLRDVVAMAFNLHEQAGHREPTMKINKLVRSILEQRGPSSKLGTQAKIYYVSQIAVRPPTIALVVNDPKLFEGQYERYMMNQLREALPFSEVPIKLIFQRRKRRPWGEHAADDQPIDTEPALESQATDEP